jgi:hypothetical protein
MAATGIGYAGIEGPWWLPAAAPFPLPATAKQELQAIARATFAFFDAVDALYGTPEGEACGLDRLLEHKVPPALLPWRSSQPVRAVRPDFQLVARDGGVGFVATELEIAPSAHGFAHAMQRGYGLVADLAQAYAAMLGDRELLIVCASPWSEFLFDQLAFCRALAEVGVRARLLCDLALTRIHAELRAGRRWQPPLFGVPQRPPVWDEDLLGRVERAGLAPFVGPPPSRWPAAVGDAMVFRFGYLGSFTPIALKRMSCWERAGATFVNPLRFTLDSKALLAARAIPAVRAMLQPDALAVLDRCIPETLLLDATRAQQIQSERANWVLKFAGFDHDEAAWGGRSLQLGGNHSDETWAAVVARYRDLPWPVVAQRTTPSVTVELASVDQQGGEAVFAGVARVRAFLLRDPLPGVYGVHLTAAQSNNVAESTGAVQAPILFAR